jgi:hypothetical protein
MAAVGVGYPRERRDDRIAPLVAELFLVAESRVDNS